MVITTLQNPKLTNNKITGTVVYNATDNFNPFWFGKPITSIIGIDDQFGAQMIILQKEVVFTESESEESAMARSNSIQSRVREPESSRFTPTRVASIPPRFTCDDVSSNPFTSSFFSSWRRSSSGRPASTRAPSSMSPLAPAKQSM